MTIERLVKARESQYKPEGCKEFRKLETFYINGVEAEYTKSEEAIELLEENDVDVSQYETEESKKAGDLHEETARKARDDHVASCQLEGCTEMREARIEYDEEQKK